MRRSSQLLVAVLTLAVGAANVRMASAYYSVAQGRFINRDPAGYRSGANLYEDRHDSPVAFTDPTGLAPPQTPAPVNSVPVPTDIETDYTKATGMLDCVFQAAGASNAAPPGGFQEPPGEYMPGIESPTGLLTKCEDLVKNGKTCDRITLAGHGMINCGFRAEVPAKAPPKPGTTEVPKESVDLYGIRCGKPTDKFDSISNCFKSRVKSGGYISNLCLRRRP